MRLLTRTPFTILTIIKKHALPSVPFKLAVKVFQHWLMSIVNTNLIITILSEIFIIVAFFHFLHMLNIDNHSNDLIIEWLC